MQMALLHIHSAGMFAIERRSNTNPVRVHIMILVCTERKDTRFILYPSLLKEILITTP